MSKRANFEVYFFYYSPQLSGVKEGTDDGRNHCLCVAEFHSLIFTFFGIYDLFMSLILGALFIRPLRQLRNMEKSTRLESMRSSSNSSISEVDGGGEKHIPTSDLEMTEMGSVDISKNSVNRDRMRNVPTSSRSRAAGKKKSGSSSEEPFKHLIVKYSILTSVAALSTFIMAFLVGLFTIVPAGPLNGAVDSLCLLLMSDKIYDGWYRKVCKVAISCVDSRWSS